MGEVVGAGVRCDVCGYELCGLAASGVCPECGEAIEMSVRPERSLRFTDPAWLESNARAMGMLAWSARGLGASGIALFLALASIGNDGEWGVWRAGIGVAVVTTMAASFVGVGLSSWRLGGLPASGRAPTMRARRWVRWGGPMISAIPCVWFGALALDPRRDSAKHAFAMVSLAAVVVGVIYLFSLSSVLEGMHRRTGDWNSEVEVWYKNFRRNLKIAVGVMGVLAGYAAVWGSLVQVGVVGMLIMVTVVIELISLETAMGRVADATRLELAVAEERAREGS
jgi:hypothetical protein